MAASKAAIGARHVLDDERLPHLLRKPIGQGPRDEIDRAAGGLRQNQLYGPRRIVILSAAILSVTWGGHRGAGDNGQNDRPFHGSLPATFRMRQRPLSERQGFEPSVSLTS